MRLCFLTLMVSLLFVPAFMYGFSAVWSLVASIFLLAVFFQDVLLRFSNGVPKARSLKSILFIYKHVLMSSLIASILLSLGPVFALILVNHSSMISSDVIDSSFSFYNLWGGNLSGQFVYDFYRIILFDSYASSIMAVLIGLFWGHKKVMHIVGPSVPLKFRNNHGKKVKDERSVAIFGEAAGFYIFIALPIFIVMLYSTEPEIITQYISVFVFPPIMTLFCLCLLWGIYSIYYLDYYSNKEEN